MCNKVISSQMTKWTTKKGIYEQSMGIILLQKDYLN